MSQSLPSSPNRRSDSVFFYDDHILPDSGKGGQLEQHSAESIEPANHDTDLEIQKHYEDLKRSLSEEFNKKMTGWGQKKLSKELGWKIWRRRSRRRIRWSRRPSAFSRVQ